MYPHRIRLRGPWECEPLARADSAAALALPPKFRITMPCRWGEGGLGDFAGRVRFRRRFSWPSRIDAPERVWLIFAGVEGNAAVSLNGQLLGTRKGCDTPFEWDVTGLLQARNDLVVEVEAPGGRGGLWGEVALEVRCTAFLRKVRWRTVAEEAGLRLEVTGEVVGTSERPLELYALLGNRTVLYATVAAAPEGRPFELRSEVIEAPGGGPQAVRIELVNGAVVWYVVEEALGG